MILDRSTLDARPTRTADVSQNLKFAALAIELEIIHDLDLVVVHDAFERHQRRDDALWGRRGGVSIGQSCNDPSDQSRRRALLVEPRCGYLGIMGDHFPTGTVSYTHLQPALRLGQRQSPGVFAAARE